MMSRLFIRVKEILLSHGAVILTALILATLIEAPVIAFPYMAGVSYRGINIPTLGGANVHEYLMRGKEVLDGHFLGSSSLREGKDNEGYYFSIAEYMLVMPVSWLGIADKVDIVVLYDFYNFVGIFSIILLIYFLVLRMSGDKLLAIASALFVVGGYSIVYNKRLFYTDFNIYGRAMFPYVASFFFFIYLNVFHKAVVERARYYEILAGVFLGLLFYIYFFAWTFSLAATSILCGLYFLRKDWTVVRGLLIVLGTGFAIGAYNVYRIATFVSSPEGKTFSYFSWLVHGRTPIFSLIGFAALLLFLIFVHKRRDDKNAMFIFAFILAGWVALNQQVVTGKILQYAHYYWFFIVPISIISGFYMVWQLLGARYLRVSVSVAAILLVLINTAGGQYRSASTVVPGKLYEQKFALILEYLKQDKNPGVILAADDANETLFAIYTPHDLFWYGFALMDKTPMERVKESLLVYLYINKESRYDVENYLKNILNDEQQPSFYKDLYQAIEGSTSGLDYYDYVARAATDLVISRHREAVINDLVAEYAAVASNGKKVMDLLLKYGVDYIVWDKNKHPEWDLSFLNNLEQAVSSGGVILYKINQ